MEGNKKRGTGPLSAPISDQHDGSQLKKQISVVSGKGCWDLLSNCKLQSEMCCMQTL